MIGLFVYCIFSQKEKDTGEIRHEKYKYIDAFGNTNFVKSTPNERTEDKV